MGIKFNLKFIEGKGVGKLNVKKKIDTLQNYWLIDKYYIYCLDSRRISIY